MSLGDDSIQEDDSSSDGEVHPSHADQYIVAPIGEKRLCEDTGLVSEDETQDAAHEETQTARVRDWISSRHINNVDLSDILSNFPDISVALTEDIMERLLKEGLLSRATKDSYTINKEVNSNSSVVKEEVEMQEIPQAEETTKTSDEDFMYMKALYHALPMDYVTIAKLQSKLDGEANQSTVRKLIDKMVQDGYIKSSGSKKLGRKATYVGRYRITDIDSLEAAKEAAGRIRLIMEAKLSPGPPILNLRLYGDNSRWHGLGINVASGNFLAAKRRGVVDGIDYGFIGEVKRIDISQIKERLHRECIVIVSNMGYSSAGEVLNCNTYEVATACALAIDADKLICITDGQIFEEQGRLSRFMSLEEADLLIRKRAEQSEIAANYVKIVGEEAINSLDYLGFSEEGHPSRNGTGYSDRDSASFQNGVGFDNRNGLWSGEQGFAIGGEERLSRLNGYLSELAAGAYVCRGGVQRVHIVDGTLGGALLLELFTRDGVGTMVARDVYEGTRMARAEDLPGIKRIIQPLEESGVLVQRTDQELLEALESFVVVERDGSIIACAALFPFFEEKCGEVAAIAVSPECRGHGQGDKLLDYIEKKASALGLEKLFLLTTRAVDWFVRRGFSECSIESIPAERRKRINLSRGSKYYLKKLQPEQGGIATDNFVLR